MTLKSIDELRHMRQHDKRRADPHVHMRHRPPQDDGAEFDAIAYSEGWLMAPSEVTRVALCPWQQAVFWGLRVYIAVMLVVMVVGFVHVAGK